MSQHDEINHPKHYQLFPGQEAIDVIRAALTPAEFVGYLKGNSLKYRLRAGDKGPAEKCIAKANWYQDYLRALDANGRIEEITLDTLPAEHPAGPLLGCLGCSRETCDCRP